jgi:hypothetical protein
MSEYRVDYSEVPGECVDYETYDGVLIHIRPPIQLNPDAVMRYLTFSDFAPIGDTQNWKNMDVKDVVLLGSTPEQTTIYASIDKGYEDEVLARQLANKTVKLLQFMGAQATLDHSPPPEA